MSETPIAYRTRTTLCTYRVHAQPQTRHTRQVHSLAELDSWFQQCVTGCRLKTFAKPKKRVFSSRARGWYGDFQTLNTRKTDSTTSQNTCVGCPKRLRSRPEVTLDRRTSPGQSYNFVRIATRAEHTGTALAFCLATELQRMTHTIARISANR